MHVLVVDAYQRDHDDAHITASAAEALISSGHTVEVLELHGLGFLEPMSADERSAYASASPLITDITQASALAVQNADALLFCYPTVLFGVPPVLKSWCERVLVQGVAFRFDDSGRLHGAMTSIRRLGAITTTPHSAAATRRARDLGRRSIMWTIRLNCHRWCRRSFMRLPAGIGPQRGADIVAKSLARW